MYKKIENDDYFKHIGGKIYPYDTIGSNYQIIESLITSKGVDLENKKELNVVDIGCANGELALAFALAGNRVTAVDYSYKHDQAPYVVSQMAKFLNVSIKIVDMSVDRYYDLSQISGAGGDQERFDLAICVGLIYHLKNPFAFLESLSSVAKNVIIGTHTMTHTPKLDHRISDYSLAYLCNSEELNNDPTNYWIFTEQAFHRCIKRSGFEILKSVIVANNDLEIAMPNSVKFGCRSFVFARSTQNSK